MGFYLKKMPDPKTCERVAKRYKGVEASALETSLSLRIFFGEYERTSQAFLQTHGLLPGRFSILMHLLVGDSNGLKATELASKIGVTRGNVTGLLDSLEESKLIKRFDAPDDRRVAFVRLTKEGEVLLQTAGGEYFRRITKMMSVLSEKERRTLLKMIEKLGKAMDFES